MDQNEEKKIIDELSSNLDKISRKVFRKYLYEMKEQYDVIPFQSYNNFLNKDEKQTKRVVYNSNIKAVRVDRWVYDKKEQVIDRFGNIYNAFANRSDSIALLIKRTMAGTEFYFIIKNDASYEGNEQKTNNGINLLKSAVKGNFPGTLISDIDFYNESHQLNEDYFDIGTKNAISVLTNIASEKSEKHISQGMEKLLNGIVPKSKEEEYTIIFLAEPVKHNDILEIRNGYEELASSIYGFAEYQTSKGTSKSTADGYSSSSAHMEGTNKSLAKTHGVNVGINTGGSSSINAGQGWLLGIAKNIRKIASKTKGINLGISAGYQYSRTSTEGSSKSDTSTLGTNYCLTKGIVENETTNVKSYPIADLVKRIEKQIERLDECEAVGMWKQAVYIIADTTLTSNNVANYLLGLTQGKNSFVEAAVINTWTKTDSDYNDFNSYVKNFIHPILVNNQDVSSIKKEHQDIIERDDFETNGYKNLLIGINDIECTTPTTYATSIELAYMMSFPFKSVQGLSSIECSEFERNVLLKDITDSERYKNVEKFSLGCIYHMHEEETNNNVYLDINTLTKHTFITGSTGSGKSTAIYKILNELIDKKKYFLVVEPAKGEYRLEFENKATVYSTNTNYGVLLNINPFYFPSEGENKIFVSEHIDRLVEIFNVCWPMYAAMPAVLKEAIERAYIAAGWDLALSENAASTKCFPAIQDVLDELPNVINESDFSNELKGNYIGSLVTRVKSLTNGIYGQIFSCNDIGDEALFKDNVILDLSRVGSVETKALIMGIIVMRMQEYHMVNNTPTDELRHVTVLEEAHNLLKKTSTEQSDESSNVLGKSVEMISNAIAEMRTYGEGFIIADQSPGMLDQSVIRNTNTKIILSLPDFSDRQLVGKAVGLEDEQINEITKLPRGKAVVYQNNWVSPVLCSIEKYKKINDKVYENIKEKKNIKEMIKEERIFKTILAEHVLYNKIDSIDLSIDNILKLNFPVGSKKLIVEKINNNEMFEKEEKIDFIFDMFYSDEFINQLKKSEVELLRDGDNRAKNRIFNKWVDTLHLSGNLNEEDVLGIINILFYRIRTECDCNVEQCENLFGSITERRWKFNDK